MPRKSAENQTALRALRNHLNPIVKQPSLPTDRALKSSSSTQKGFGGHGHFPIVLRFDRQHLTQSDTLEFVSERTAIEELSDIFVFLADHDFAGYSPTYEQLARAIAVDTQLLEFVLTSASPNTRRGRIPVLFFAATHDRILANPESEIARVYRGESDSDPLRPFLELVELERESIVHNMRTRSVQTNEVGRSAGIALGLSALTLNDRDIALVEIGPSAGLNLFVDHWHADYLLNETVVRELGPVDSPIQLACELRGDLIPPEGRIGRISQRTGVDPAPIDASNVTESRWLQACVWPGIPERPERLAAALAIVARTPPPLVQGDAVVDLIPLVEAMSDECVPVIVSTWALAYVSAGGRETIQTSIDALGAKRDLALLTLEEPRFTPWIETPDELVTTYFEAGDGTPTVLGLRQWVNGKCSSRVLALCHPHVRWLRWLEEEADYG